MKAKDRSLVLDYKTKWLRKYTGGWDGTEETRDYFEQLIARLRKAYEGKAGPGRAGQVLLVPAGDVLLELHERMRVGKVPGFSDIAEVYVDGIHFNNVGRECGLAAGKSLSTDALSLLIGQAPA